MKIVKGKVNQSRLDEVLGWSLEHGSHEKNDGGHACVMEFR